MQTIIVANGLDQSKSLIAGMELVILIEIRKRRDGYFVSLRPVD